MTTVGGLGLNVGSLTMDPVAIIGIPPLSVAGG